MIGRSLLGLYIVLNARPDKKAMKWYFAAQKSKRAYVTPCKSRNPVKYVQNFLLQVRFEIKNEPKT